MALSTRSISISKAQPLLARGRLALRGPAKAYYAMRGQLAAWRELSYLAPALERARPYSMVPKEALIELARQTRHVLAQGIPGDFVECGVWRGGASFLMADLLRREGVQDRRVWLFDSFEGHRAPEEIDGAAAQQYVTNTDDPQYYDNCRVAVEDVRRAAEQLGLSDRTEIVPGWFDETLPVTRERIGPIALLRLDCDWYASVRCCLDTLYDQVADGGYVILDDYYAYDGCAIALHEFLVERRLPHRIHSGAGVAYFRKS